MQSDQSNEALMRTARLDSRQWKLRMFNFCLIISRSDLSENSCTHLILLNQTSTHASGDETLQQEKRKESDKENTKGRADVHVNVWLQRSNTLIWTARLHSPRVETANVCSFSHH